MPAVEVFEHAMLSMRSDALAAAVGDRGDFVDIGSGRGKMLALCALLFGGERFERCVGVDVVENRINESQRRFRALIESLGGDAQAKLARRIETRVVSQLGDIGNDTVALPLLRRASMVYMYATCFSEDLHALIVRQLLRYLPRGALVVIAGGEASQVWQLAITVDAQFELLATRDEHVGKVRILKRA